MLTRLSLNQKGSSFISVLVLCVMVGMVAAVISNFNVQTRKIAVKSSAPTTARLIKQKLLNLVLTPASWQVIQSKNSHAFASFDPANPPLLDIYQANSNTAYYATTDQASGFDYSAKPCQNYVANLSNEGNDSCPFRYHIYLKNRSLVNGSWVDTLHFELNYHPKTQDIIFNASTIEFNFDIARNLNEQSVEASCIAIGGIYNAVTNECSNKLTNTIANCGTGKVFKSQQNTLPSNNCVNTSVSQLNCSGTQVIKGFTSQGNPICGSPL